MSHTFDANIVEVSVWICKNYLHCQLFLLLPLFDTYIISFETPVNHSILRFPRQTARFQPSSAGPKLEMLMVMREIEKSIMESITKRELTFQKVSFTFFWRELLKFHLDVSKSFVQCTCTGLISSFTYFLGNNITPGQMQSGMALPKTLFTSQGNVQKCAQFRSRGALTSRWWPFGPAWLRPSQPKNP